MVGPGGHGVGSGTHAIGANMGFFDAIPGMISNIIGGVMNQNAQENANAANQALQQTQMAYQHEANTHGIRWKVQDAIAAGLHPLAALGVSPASGFSASVGRQEPESGLGDSVKGMGQDITRAIQATRTAGEREQAFQNTIQKLTVDREGMKNELIALQIARLKNQANPPFPGDIWGSNPTNIPGYQDKPSDRVPSSPSQPHMEFGTITDVGHSRSPTGYPSIPGKDIKERIEDVAPYEYSHFIRNNFYNSLGYGYPPKDIPLKPGHHWEWHHVKQEWQQRGDDYWTRPWMVRYGASKPGITGSGPWPWEVGPGKAY